MSAFAPPYNPSKHQQSFLARQQKAASRKRKREPDSSGDEAATAAGSGSSREPTPRTAPSSFHPVNKTDPYYIAGHPREDPLPPPPFPHAAIKEIGIPQKPLEEELASLNPPVYIPPEAVEDKSISLRRRHLDNITTILHQCMLKGDWERAHRAWNLLIRTEVNGRGVDVRRHGRWGIGAELLMRQGGRASDRSPGKPHDRTEERSFTDEGSKLARAYYERLILQYPYTQQTQHHLNATAIYPALFNIWIYATQDQAKRARHAVQSRRETSEQSTWSSSPPRNQQLKTILDEELTEATAIASRVEELVRSPPYDTDTTLLQLQGMVALWLADLHSDALASTTSDPEDSSSMSNTLSDSVATDAHASKTGSERRKARDIFARLDAQGVDLPASTRRFLENEDDS